LLEDLNLYQYANTHALESIVEEGGRNLSGGEKRRICLARAFMRRAPLLILDEPLANLDDENANIVEDCILKYRESIVIVISHQFNKNKEGEFDKIVLI
jgi:ABC-type transport system involved in cytochrome bd biosynthesis fused ATPase/permease subunit